MDPLANVVMSVCPYCGEDVQFLERYKVGQIVCCISCESRLEILSCNPPILDWPSAHDS
jgi:lysine biosynthesis protein LysW